MYKGALNFEIISNMVLPNCNTCLLEKESGQRFIFSIRGAYQSLETDPTSVRILTREGKLVAEKKMLAENSDKENDN